MRTASAVRPPNTWTELTPCRHQEFKARLSPELAYCGTACRARPCGFTTAPPAILCRGHTGFAKVFLAPQRCAGPPRSGQSELCARTEIARNEAQLSSGAWPVGVTQGSCAIGEEGAPNGTTHSRPAMLEQPTQTSPQTRSGSFPSRRNASRRPDQRQALPPQATGGPTGFRSRLATIRNMTQPRPRRPSRGLWS